MITNIKKLLKLAKRTNTERLKIAKISKKN